ncbi:hypothetical protein L596_015865 [Steinernema carpocapsae]|uniref:PABS domain-containing protein n=1 Tax=Steinernema carpocapsae TaxID=34508 RepID=A0A4U5NHH0_STECR|nr:hypothetical protein L596_015865 [Steinernema carpocapsae]
MGREFLNRLWKADFETFTATRIFRLIDGINTWLFHWYVIDENYGKLASEADLNKLKNSVTVDSICSPIISETCFTVKDVFDEESNVVSRVILVKGFDDEYDTSVKLISPRNLSFHDSDTRTWKIDHSAMNSQYIAAIIAAPFMVGALSMEKAGNAKRNLLSIGLGGGSLDMFIHTSVPEINITTVELDPAVVDIARRWFDVVDDPLRRTIVGDGFKFLEKAAKDGGFFDVVVIDACDGNKAIPCPAVAFRDEAMIANAKKVLKTMGCLVVNILTKDETRTDEVIDLLHKEFPVCIRALLPNEYNVPVVCLPYELEDSDSSLLLYKKRFEMALNRFGLGAILQNVVFRNL